MNLRRNPRPQRAGTAAVEFAVCLPFLLVLIMGIWEVGRMVQVQQLIANAAREGGRQAAAGQQSNTYVRQYVVNYLNANGLSGVDLTMVTLVNVTSSARNEPTAGQQLDEYRVTVSVPYSTIRWSTLAQITSTSTLTASADWYCMLDVPLTLDATIPAN